MIHKHLVLQHFAASMAKARYEAVSGMETWRSPEQLGLFEAHTNPITRSVEHVLLALQAQERAARDSGARSCPIQMPHQAKFLIARKTCDFMRRGTRAPRPGDPCTGRPCRRACARARRPGQARWPRARSRRPHGTGAASWRPPRSWPGWPPPQAPAQPPPCTWPARPAGGHI